MKLDPLNIVLDPHLKLNKIFYFISGNEKSFIEKINVKIIENYKKDKKISVSNVASIKDYDCGVGLFEDNKIISINNCTTIDEEDKATIQDIYKANYFVKLEVIFINHEIIFIVKLKPV